MQTHTYYLKHSFSQLQDRAFVVEVDEANHLVTISTDVFDSGLMERLIQTYLPEDHGIIAFTDDDAEGTQRPQYALAVKLGARGQLFRAHAVLLSQSLYKSPRRLVITMAVD